MDFITGLPRSDILTGVLDKCLEGAVVSAIARQKLSLNWMNLPLGRELLTNRLPTNTMRHAGSELRARMERLQEKRFIHRLKRRLRLQWVATRWVEP